MPQPPFRQLKAALYDRMTKAMEERVFGPRRRRLLAEAEGRVLDVGGGTGANLPYYRFERMTKLSLLDPDGAMLDRARRKAAEIGAVVEFCVAYAEAMPFADESFDTVVFTLSLCTIPDPSRALHEARRVLSPRGKLLVFEHVQAAEPSVAKWQKRATPVWSVIAPGRHLDRDTRTTMETAGFVLEKREEGRETAIPFRILQPHLLAVARKAG
jgi:ubiquinone/menaquinone biosynthesis C-methylase UbiE